MQGVVLKAAGALFSVKDPASGRMYECKVRGKLRLKELKTTHVAVVGDQVEFQPSGENEGLIESILERKNYLIRKSTNLSKEAHVIAANIDLALLVVCLSRPQTNLEFVDRFLATAEAYKIPVCIVINKIDEYNEAERDAVEGWKQLYESIPYRVYEISARTGLGMEKLRSDIAHKMVLLSGNSGVGKSTIINAWADQTKARTGAISDYHHKGKHTTTFSEIFELGEDTYLIDTPGIKGFGLVDIAEEELCHYFPDLFAFSSGCKFYNCTHQHEPGCAVAQAVEDGKIHPSRYYNYLKILIGDEGKYR